jgi:hypothetical protein
MPAKQPTISYRARDETGSYGTLRFHLPDSTTRDSGIAAATDFRPIIEGITSCTIERQSLVFVWQIDSPAAGAGVATRTGVFVFSTSEPDQFAVVAVPGIRESVLIDSGIGAGLVIDLEHPDVESFVDALISDLWCNPFGFQLVEVQAAFMQIRDL